MTLQRLLSGLRYLIYEENFVLFFISVHIIRIITGILPQGGDKSKKILVTVFS